MGARRCRIGRAWATMDTSILTMAWLLLAHRAESLLLPLAPLHGAIAAAACPIPRCAAIASATAASCHDTAATIMLL